MPKRSREKWEETTVDLDAVGSNHIPDGTNPYLMVLEGPDAGARFCLTKGQNIIGRSQNANIQIHDEMVSSKHFIIHVNNDAITLQDCGSKNGTYVNGNMVKEAALDSLSRLRIGHTLMRIEYKTDLEIGLEQALIHSERLAAVGTLSAGMAHEFNNINAVVLGYSELILSRDNLDDDVRKWLEYIRESALRTKDLTQRLLSFSGQRVGEKSSQRLDRIVRDTVSLVREEFATEGIEWDLHIEETPKSILDAAAIGQVILNLLVNARHSMIDCPQKRISIRVGHTSSTIWFKIEDTGCGIPANVLKDIFTPFFSTKGEHAQGDSPQSRVKGTGLGLSISHTAIANHGGEITVQSSEGKGTAFTVTLPVNSPKSSASHMDTTVTTTLPKGKRAVILDDEKHLQYIMAEFLDSAGCEARSTDDGQQALDWIEKGEVDLVMLDLQMPKMSGSEFLKKLQAIDEDKRPSVIIVTGRALEADLSQYYDMGVADVVFKPFEGSEVIRKVRKVMVMQKKKNK